jgi:ABC-type glycerol-3-phosphate transport system substrate-binding protein
MNMSKFQIGLLVVFGVFALVAVVLFARSRGNSAATINLVVWGPISEYDFHNTLQASGLDVSDAIKWNYKEKKLDTLSSEFTQALAIDKGPDLIILPVESLLQEKAKLMLIPAESVKPADFVNTFIKEGELFLTTAGTYALPFYVDPMVLYWNKETFASAGLATPPVYWDQIYDYIGKLTKRDAAGNLTSSAIALGESKNIPHAKEILSMLIMQAGSPIVTSFGETHRSTLLENNGAAQIPAIAALEFYTQFANPQKTYYTWNRSLLSADTSFTSGKSAMYLGFASELPVLKAKNPTLDLGVSPVPQSRASGRAATYGRLFGVAVSRGARDKAGALAGAVALVAKDAVKGLAASTPLIPARRDILSESPTDPAGFVFYGAALISRGWLDPNTSETDKIFVNMIESVTSGRARVDEAVQSAHNSLSNQFKP